MYEIMPLTRRSTLTRAYDPFSIFDEIEKSFFNRGTSTLGFKTDIKDTGDAYEIEAELPGFDKDQIDIEVQNDVLTISAIRKDEHEEKDENGKYIRRERSYGSFSRGFDVSDVDVNSITVGYDNGILAIKMPKKGEQEPEVRKLTIG